ncbi:MAG: monovalent cation/H+ antiporter complex subunit F [Chloroflexota bacterium]|nr:monovalent cation/H+ antiporter complex subunit F [Chloroflexota bacterium]
MHTVVFYLAAVWITALLGLSAVLIVRARSLLVRVLALETFTMILIALLTLFAHATRSAYYLDAALILALLSFTGTVAAARYRSEGRIFS